MNAKKRAALAWYESLNDAERRAVDYYLMTGNTRFIDLLKPTSKRLQRYTLKPFAIVQTDAPALNISQPISLN